MSEKNKTIFLKSKEAADYLSVSQKTLYRLRVSGELNYYRFKNLIRLKKSDLDAFIEQYRERAFQK